MSLKSYIPYPPDSDFPIQNLPYGIFSTADNVTPRIGVAIADLILDLKNSTNVFSNPLLKRAFQQETLNSFMSLGRNVWKEARQNLQSYLSIENESNLNHGVFIKQSEAVMHLPAQIGDYTDFFSSYYHAYNCSLLFEKDIFTSNWRHVPIAYHGRASSIFISGTEVKRPSGQIIPPNETNPIFSPTKRLDYELEVGIFIGGPLNKPGDILNIQNVQDYIFGMVLLNDWSARDIQAWEMVPLGPFLSKNFATSISPWIVTMEALQPFIVDNMAQEPIPLNYLRHSDNYNFDITLEAYLKANDSTVTKLSKTNYKYLYWTAKQQLCHHSITGCVLRAGDLLGSGTISGPTQDSLGCLVESTLNGVNALPLINGQTRTFLQDEDEIILTGYCTGDGYRIGFGRCSGKIVPNT